MQMHNPVCAIVYRDPIVNAQRLYKHFKHHSERTGKAVMTQEQVQAVWEEGELCVSEFSHSVSRSCCVLSAESRLVC